jgi:hypothetical protein
MRFALLILVASLILTGCARTRTTDVRTDTAPVTPVVTPSPAAVGSVTSVNPTHRFVVVSFPPGRVPGANERLDVYRRGLKLGELRVTGPQIDSNTVADITAGEAQVGDEVRTN